MTTSQQKAINDLKVQIRVARAKLGLSYAALGKMCGVSEQLCGMWCRAPENLTAARWATLNSVLHLDPTNYNIACGFVRGGE